MVIQCEIMCHSSPHPGYIPQFSLRTQKSVNVKNETIPSGSSLVIFLNLILYLYSYQNTREASIGPLSLQEGYKDF